MRQNDQPPWVRDRRRTIGRRLQDARLYANLTQEAAAEAVGVDRRTIQAWEAGTADPPLGRLLLFAAAVGVPLTDLLK
ncbi:helix-turn-helix transcriptional regulator [Streptomyces sp. 184]|uniref:helix-turn-helix transcriptional regulator n=1 Tax=Streptomyces sp. 184 TaxID=1827526 RepID=UPI0038911EA8